MLVKNGMNIMNTWSIINTVAIGIIFSAAIFMPGRRFST